MDALTARHLVFANKSNDAELRNRIDSVCSKERVLDGPPEKYSSITRNLEVVQFGIYARFIRLFQNFVETREHTDCVIKTDSKEIKCDYGVYIALLCLMNLSNSRSEECAEACKTVFNTILDSEQDGVITQERVYSTLHQSGHYYKDEICQAIVDSVYTKEQVVKFEIKNRVSGVDVEKVYNLLGRPEDMDALNDKVKQVYKKARANQDFIIPKTASKLAVVCRYIETYGEE